MAPIVRPPSGSASILSSGSRLMSTSVLRLLDVQLHQIDQRRAAGDEANLRALLCCFRLRCRGNGLSAIARPYELESLHPGFCAVSVLPHTLDRGHDVLIRAATADVATHELLHVRVLRSARFLQAARPPT